MSMSADALHLEAVRKRLIDAVLKASFGGDRSAAGRYAAQIRWGNRGGDGPQPRGQVTKVDYLVEEATFDANEAIATGRPYAPLLEENLPQDLQDMLLDPNHADDWREINTPFATDHAKEVQSRLAEHYKTVLDPSNLSPDTKAKIEGTESFFQTRLLTDPRQMDDLANEIARQTILRQAERVFAEDMFGSVDKSVENAKVLVGDPKRRLAVAVPRDVVMQVMEDGRFKNQFESGKSGGYLGNDVRAEHEAVAYGVHPLTLPQKRPIYASLHPVGVTHSNTNETQHYGNVQFVLKSSVDSRATMAIADSLMTVRNANRLTNPTRPQAYGVITTDSPSRMAFWRFGTPEQYAEAQIHGGVSLKDVAYIAFSKDEWNKNLPKGFREKAKSLGIPIVIIEENQRKPIDDSAVAKSYAMHLEKAQPRKFSSRAEAARYAAQIRWGSPKQSQDNPATEHVIPDGWTKVAERVNPDGTSRLEIEQPDPDGGTISAVIRSHGEGQVDVELTRIGGVQRQLGHMWATEDGGKMVIQEISVHSQEQRKGYATMMLNLGRTSNLRGYEIVHSTQLTDAGRGFAEAVKSEHLEKGRPRKFATRAEAAAYAANIRWGNRGSSGNPPDDDAKAIEDIRVSAAKAHAALSAITEERIREMTGDIDSNADWDNQDGLLVTRANNRIVPTKEAVDAEFLVQETGAKILELAQQRVARRYAAEGRNVSMESIESGQAGKADIAAEMRKVVLEVAGPSGEIRRYSSSSTDPAAVADFEDGIKLLKQGIPAAVSDGIPELNFGTKSNEMGAHYEPQTRKIVLSTSHVGTKEAITCIPHEYGHAIQHAFPSLLVVNGVHTARRIRSSSSSTPNPTKRPKTLKEIRSEARDAQREEFWIQRPLGTDGRMSLPNTVIDSFLAPYSGTMYRQTDQFGQYKHHFFNDGSTSVSVATSRSGLRFYAVNENFSTGMEMLFRTGKPSVLFHDKYFDTELMAHVAGALVALGTPVTKAADALHLEKGRPRKFATRAEAAAYAANIRWGNRGSSGNPPDDDAKAIEDIRSTAAKAGAAMSAITEERFRAMTDEIDPNADWDNKDGLLVTEANGRPIPTKEAVDAEFLVQETGVKILELAQQRVARRYAEEGKAPPSTLGLSEEDNLAVVTEMRKILLEVGGPSGEIKWNKSGDVNPAAVDDLETGLKLLKQGLPKAVSDAVPEIWFGTKSDEMGAHYEPSTRKIVLSIAHVGKPDAIPCIPHEYGHAIQDSFPSLLVVNQVHTARRIRTLSSPTTVSQYRIRAKTVAEIRGEARDGQDESFWNNRPSGKDGTEPFPSKVEDSFRASYSGAMYRRLGQFNEFRHHYLNNPFETVIADKNSGQRFYAVNENFSTGMEMLFRPSTTRTMFHEAAFDTELIAHVAGALAALATGVTKAADALHLEKGRPRKFSTRAEAAAYAANIRWGNRGGNEPPVPPHIQEMRTEAAAIRAEVERLNETVSFDDLKRSSPKAGGRNWKDENGAIQINTANEEMIPSPEVADLHDRVLALGTKVHQEALRRASSEAVDGEVPSDVLARHMHQVVAEIAPVGGKITVARIEGNSARMDNAELSKSFDLVASVLPTTWVDASKKRPLTILSDNGEILPSYRNADNRIAFPSIGGFQARFTGHTVDRMVGHEYTHMVEFQRPAVAALSLAFVTHRTTGFQLRDADSPSPLPSLRNRMLTVAADKRVMARSSGGNVYQISKDSFTNLYSGRRYDVAEKHDPYSIYRRPNNNRQHLASFEVLTTGIEQFIGGNADNFDDDHMSFVLGMLVST